MVLDICKGLGDGCGHMQGFRQQELELDKVVIRDAGIGDLNIRNKAAIYLGDNKVQSVTCSVSWSLGRL